MLTKCNILSDLAVQIFVTGMFHIGPENDSSLSLVSDALVGLPCVYLWVTGWTSKYTLYAVVIRLLRFLRSGKFSAEIKKKYRLHRWRVQLHGMKYGCDLKAWNWTKALWSGNLRRQQLWHGCLHCRWKESRGSFFFFVHPPICLSLLCILQ